MPILLGSFISFFLLFYSTPGHTAEDIQKRMQAIEQQRENYYRQVQDRQRHMIAQQQLQAMQEQQRAFVGELNQRMAQQQQSMRQLYAYASQQQAVVEAIKQRVLTTLPPDPRIKESEARLRERIKQREHEREIKKESQEREAAIEKTEEQLAKIKEMDPGAVLAAGPKSYDEVAQRRLEHQKQLKERVQKNTFSDAGAGVDGEETIITMAQVWEELGRSSEIWTQMMDREPKEITVQSFIDAYHDAGITISKPAAHYVDLIDFITMDNKELLGWPFKDVVMYVAILEYDFDNGQDKEALAKEMLGDPLYASNRKRLGMEI